MLSTLTKERRRGPLEPFEKRVLAGFVIAALIQSVLGIYRAELREVSYVGPIVAAVAVLVCGALWLLRFRRMPGGAVAMPAGLLLATAGVYSGYTATNVPFVGFVGRFSVPLLLLLVGALLLFAEQEWQFQAVVVALTAIAFVVVQVVLTSEARSDGNPIPSAMRTSPAESGLDKELR